MIWSSAAWHQMVLFPVTVHQSDFPDQSERRSHSALLYILLRMLYHNLEENKLEHIKVSNTEHHYVQYGNLTA